MIKNLLYLHGFRSSPLSTKSQIMAKYMQENHPNINWWCPQLPPSPKQACELILEGTKDWAAEEMAVVGSSLGGFYANWLAQQRGCKAALINPSTDPYSTLKDQVGQLSTWQHPESKFEFTQEYVDELRNYYVKELRNPKNVFAIIAKGDEVIDWRISVDNLKGAEILLLDGSDHALSDFTEHMPKLLSFLGLSDNS